MPDTVAHITVSASDLASAVFEGVHKAIGSVGDAASASAGVTSGAGETMTGAIQSVSDHLSAVGGHAAAFDAAIMTGVIDPLSAVPEATGTAEGGLSGLLDHLRSFVSDGLEKTGESVEGLGEKITAFAENPLGAAKEGLSGILEHLGPMGVGLGAIVGAVGAVGTAMFEMAEHAAKTGEDVLNFSRVTGTAVGAVGALSAAGEIGGTSLDGLQGMLVQMQRRLDASGPGADKLNAALADLGINSETFRAADPTDRIAMLSQGLQGAAGSTNLMSDALAIMGRSGVQNLPFLMKNFDELKASGETLGYTWSVTDTEAAEHLGIATGKTSVEMSTLSTAIGVALIPAVTAGVEGFNRLILAVEHVADLGGLVSGTWGLITGLLGDFDAAQQAAIGHADALKTKLDADNNKKYGASVKEMSDAENAWNEISGQTNAILVSSAKAIADAQKESDNYAAAWGRINVAFNESGPKAGDLSAHLRGLITDMVNAGVSSGDIVTALKTQGLTQDQITVGIDAAKTAQQEYRGELHDTTTVSDLLAKSQGAINQAVNTGIGLTDAQKSAWQVFDQMGLTPVKNKYFDFDGVLQTTSSYMLTQASTAIPGLINANQGLIKENADTQKSIEVTSQLWGEYYKLQAENSGDTKKAKMIDVDNWFTHEVDKLKDDDTNWSDHYDALYAVAQIKMQKIKEATDPYFAAVKTDLADMYGGFSKTFSDTLIKTHDFGDAVGLTFDKMKLDVEQTLAGLLQDFIQQFFSKLMEKLGVVLAEDTAIALLQAFIFFDKGGIVPEYGGTPQYFAAGVGAVQYYDAGGGPRGTDTVPAWLTPGEMVLTGGQQQGLFGGMNETTSAVRALHVDIKGLRSELKNLPILLAHAVRGR